MKKRIKVLHALPNLSGGGAEKIVVDILLNLDQSKFELFLLLFKKNNLGEDFKDKLRKKGIVLVELKKRCLIDLINLYQIYKNLKILKLDICHTHLGADLYLRLIARLLKVPHIISTQHNINYLESLAQRIYKKLSLKKDAITIAVSQTVKNDIVKRYNLRKSSIKVVYNGVDLNYFQAHKKKIDVNNNFLLGSLGRLNSQKDYQFLIKAIAKTRRDNIKLLIAGEGEEKENLNSLIRKLKLEDKVFLLGFKQAKEFLKEIDVFIFSSLWEGLGIAILEAMAMEKPLILRDIDTVREIIDEHSAYLYQTEAQLISILENFKYDEKRVKRAKKIVQANFSLEKTVSDYQKIYEDITSQ